MSRDGSISFEWADGEHKFRLALGQLRELQEKLDAGPEMVFTRLENGSWRVEDILETIRLGLIGGGVESTKARVLVQRYVGAGMLLDNVMPAMQIIAAALIGAPDEAPKKEMGEEEIVPTHSPEGNGALPYSTETVQ